MSQAPGPFSCTYSPNIPGLLVQLRLTLAISTYQAGKVIFISPKNEEFLVQLPRTFDKAMGIAFHGKKMAIATKEEVIVLANSPGLAHAYPKQPNTYDALFMPRATYYTGMVDIHDMDFGKDGLWAINTSFSCLSTIDDNYSFTPKWKPSFISDLVSEDRCHLNGLCLENGEPKFVSTLGTGNTPKSWRESITNGGSLIDVKSNEFVLKDLPMPHSPRESKGNYYLLLSATGDFVKVNPKDNSYDVITNLKGFVRGLAIHGDFAFIGMSKLRENSSTFNQLDVAKLANWAGISVVHIPTGAIMGEIRYQSSVDEIYDIQVLPEMQRPGILNTIRPEFRMGLDTPDATYWARDIAQKGS